jgi:hypothetical protein
MTRPEERREVAATLRDAKRKCESRGYPWMCDDLCLAIGYEPDYEADNGIFERLANLIDPTCEAVHSATSADDELVCSECGADLGVEIYGGQTLVSNFCPCCGARVEYGDWDD